MKGYRGSQLDGVTLQSIKDGNCTLSLKLDFEQNEQQPPKKKQRISKDKQQAKKIPSELIILDDD